MNKVQNSWETTCSELNARLRAYDGSPQELSKSARVNYHAARRALLSGIKNQTKLSDSLCTYFKIYYKEDKVQTRENWSKPKLRKVLEDVWDGSEAHAELIAQLLQSTKVFRIERKSADIE